MKLYVSYIKEADEVWSFSMSKVKGKNPILKPAMNGYNTLYIEMYTNPSYLALYWRMLSLKSQLL